VRGFGAKFEEQVLAAFAAGVAERPKPRTLLPRALEIAEAIIAPLREHPASGRVELAGSARRLADSVKDLDIIATASDPGALLRAFAELDVIERSGSPGDNAARGRTHTGLDVDLRVVEPDQFGNLLQHFTGSKAHNVAIREAAVRRGLHVSEYGILDDASGETLRCENEEAVYARLGLPWIPPELREDRGELALADGEVPVLIEQSDLKGDLHMHTTASDGRQSIEQMAVAARERGLQYIAITDHSASHGFGNDVSPDQLRKQIEKVRAVDATLEGITVLIGTEANIGLDGAPDYDDELLAELDWVIASVHTSFAMDMTERICAVMEHPLVDAIGHPTGRKISSREPYAVDMDRVIETALRTHTMLEINSAPDRRDLHDVHARAAARAGVPILIDSDAHGAETLGNTRWGVATARRAWLTAADVANTRPWPELRALSKHGRR
ncbi:MAG: PHP domain-containing protein, partial [Solirubrobacteraceae bacterium]